MVESGSPDFPFCLCWASESWSWRWDGSERDVLMQQKHRPELDLEFARSVPPYFPDPRNIRVDGKPMLIVYRPNVLPICRPHCCAGANSSARKASARSPWSRR